MRRRLVLSKETLTELATADLTAIHGAAALPTSPGRTGCVIELASRVVECTSVFVPCITFTGCITWTGCTL